MQAAIVFLRDGAHKLQPKTGAVAEIYQLRTALHIPEQGVHRGLRHTAAVVGDGEDDAVVPVEKAYAYPR